MSPLSESLRPPYFAAVVSPNGAVQERAGVLAMETMISLAPRLDGFLGLETARLTDGTRAAVCYWQSAEAISRWKMRVLKRLILDHNGQHRRIEEACAIDVICVAKRLFGKRLPKLPKVLSTTTQTDTREARA